LIGIGWGADGFDDSSPSVEEYSAAYQNKPNPSVICFLQLRLDDLVWFRSRKGVYFLARITGDWRSWNTPIAKELDLRNVRDAEIVEAGSEDETPGTVIAAFRPSRTFQAIHSGTALDYSQTLFNDRSGRRQYPDAGRQQHDLFDLINAEDLEDLVLMYLQSKGWLYVPSSRKRSTLRYEAVMIRTEDGLRAYPQVKSGTTRLRPADYAGGEQVFLFAGGGYVGQKPDNVTLLSKEELLSFCRERPELIPNRIRRHYRHIIGEAHAI
jgi:hypothetical protein